MNNNIIDYIRTIANTNDYVYSEPGVVRRINKTNNTCDVERYYGNKDFDKAITNEEYVIKEVKLCATSDKGYIIYPVINSDVIVSFESRHTSYVSMYSEVDDINISVSKTYTINNTKNSIIMDATRVLVTTDESLNDGNGSSIEVTDNRVYIKRKIGNAVYDLGIGENGSETGMYVSNPVYFLNLNTSDGFDYGMLNNPTITYKNMVNELLDIISTLASVNPAGTPVGLPIFSDVAGTPVATRILTFKTKYATLL